METKTGIIRMYLPIMGAFYEVYLHYRHESTCKWSNGERLELLRDVAPAHRSIYQLRQ